jgi:hypothetical protein
MKWKGCEGSSHDLADFPRTCTEDMSKIMKTRMIFGALANTGNRHIPTKRHLPVSQFGPFPALNRKTTRSN